MKETKELLDYAEALVERIGEDKADDGKITYAEIATTLVLTSPSGIKAVMGVSSIDEEIKNLTDEEKEELLTRSLSIVRELSQIFFPAG